MNKKQESIWTNDTEIKVIGVTGEYRSGKTLFGLSIDPENTLLYDFEMSANTYSGLWKDRVDVMAQMSEGNNELKPVEVFRRVMGAIDQLQPGLYSVIALDPASDFEMGLADHVAESYKDYGFKSRDAFEKTGGIFWSNVKAYWKSKLAMIAQKCQTLVFTTHMRNVWVGGKPTSQKEPMGKNTLMELATLYLHLSRKKGNKETEQPWAKVLKSRLAETKVVDGKPVIKPLLPPTLPVATPEAIRQYILTPPDYSKLKAGEKPSDDKLSDADKQVLEESIALSRQATAEAELETEKMRQNARGLVEARRNDKSKNETPKVKTASKEEGKAKVNVPTSKAPQGATKEESEVSGITAPQIKYIGTLVKKLGYEQDAWKSALKKKFDVETIRNLTQPQAAELIKSLDEKWKKKAPPVKTDSKNDYDNWAQEALA